MSGIMVLKYKKTLRIVGICIICWLYALAFAVLASSCGRRGRKHRREYGKDSFAPLEHIRYERRKDSRHCRPPCPKMRLPFIG